MLAALVVDALFGAFASIAFLQFLLFALVEIRQTLLVWRAQRNNGRGDDSMWNIQRDMSAVYTRFYSFLLLGKRNAAWMCCLGFCTGGVLA